MPELFLLMGIGFIAARLQSQQGFTRAFRRVGHQAVVVGLILALNVSLNLGAITDTTEYIKSASHLASGIIAFQLTFSYTLHLCISGRKQLLFLFTAGVLFLLTLVAALEIMDVFSLRDSLDAVRRTLYEYSDLQGRYEHDITVAGFPRPAVFTREPSWLAHHVVLCIGILAMCCVRPQGRNVTAVGVMLLFLVAGIVTGSPISVVGGICGIGWVLFRARGLVITGAGIIMLCGAGVFFVINSELPGRFERIISGEDASAKMRFASLKMVSEIAINNPLSGYAFGESEDLYRLWPDELSRQGLFKADSLAHNAPGALAVVLGLPGLLLLLAAHWVAVKGQGSAEAVFRYLVFGAVLMASTGDVCAARFWVPLGALFALAVSEAGDKRSKYQYAKVSRGRSITPCRSQT